MKPYAFHPEAEEEYADSARYYAKIGADMGGRFYDEIERLISDVRRHPERFRFFDPPVQRHFSDVFPYAVIYVNRPERVLLRKRHPRHHYPGVISVIA